ncbi:hypothetical protein [Vreelandella titanicae]|uniref:hypothetical protein n=1 Tax=Vreelandella titanicae TaxID=664683 RepID=UPI0016815439|nr:hypothetical protein [Halomonas titanicae]QNU62785.1 hypothetical protein HZS52_24190 [Halomonas titanicae]
MGLLRSIASNRCSDFSGTGVIFYSDLSKLPHLQLTTGCEEPNVTKLGDHDIASALVSVSTMCGPFHDGFHFINMSSWQMTHVSQFISPPIPHDAAQRCHGTGARLMAAMLASLLPGIIFVGLVSQGGQVHLFCDGVDIAGEN